MKKITYTIGIAFALLTSTNAIAQQGFGTNRPDKSSAVEIKSPNKGLLIPRVSLTSSTDVTTIVAPANSLLIYNEKAVSNELHEGYYYWNASKNKWISFSTSLNQDKTTVTQDGQNITVASTPTVQADGTTVTDYKVKITPGEDKQFLVTKLVNGTAQTIWVPYSEIATGIEAKNGLKMVDNTIKLGGPLTEDTEIISAGKKLLFIDLPDTTTLDDHKVLVTGDDGQVKEATTTQIVTSGLLHNLTSDVNTMKSTINGVDKTAPIVNTHTLEIESGTTVLTSEVNGVEATKDLKETIQLGQVKYEVIEGTGVTIDTTGSTADLKKFTVNADAGAITLDGDVTGAASSNKVVKIQNVPVSVTPPTAGQVLKEVSGTWTPSTLTTDDVTDGKKLSSTDLSISTVDNKALLQDLTININNNAVTAAKLNDDTAGLGLVRNETSKALDVNAKNGLKIVNDEVVLGGELTQVTKITTTSTNTLAIEGLQTETAVEKVMVVDANGVLKTASIDVLNATNDIITVNASHTATLANETILVNASSTANVEVELPAAALTNKGKRYYIKLIATNIANTNTVTISSTSKIDGETSPIVSSSPYQAWLLQSDGENWYVVGY